MAHAMVQGGGRLMAGPREFETFYAASYRRLVTQLLGVTGNLHDAEDVVQEAFARAAVRWRRVSEYEAPEAWVRRVAFNLAVSAARRSRRFLAAAARAGADQQVPGLSADDLDPAARCGSRTAAGSTPAATAASPPSSRSRPAPPGTSSSTPPAAGRPRR
jgi:DNA-directed RNA polymerase specialized sigma24 family protein